MTVTDPDPAVAELEAIREHLARVCRERMNAPSESAAAIRASARDVPRLLAVAEAALNLAAEWDAKGAEIWSQIELQDCDGASAGFKAIGGTVHQNCAKALREAITGALTGKENPDVT